MLHPTHDIVRLLTVAISMVIFVYNSVNASTEKFTSVSDRVSVTIRVLEGTVRPHV